LTPELLKDAFETNSRLKIFNIYGLTEAGRACYRVIEASSPPSNSIGRAAPGVEITIEGSNGEPGEIIIRGPNVMMGYFQGIQDDLVTLKTCTEMRTGDLGYYNERDEIELLGRRDHMFNIKGEKIHPAEIERIAVQAPGVADAQARTSADTNGDIFVLLDVVPGNGAFDIGQVNTYVRKHLSPAFFPREIRVVPDLRRTELGSKIIRRQAST
jgi:acyl-CoA synthetase (AMP-forming)/AMP-acid ligase II